MPLAVLGRGAREAEGAREVRHRAVVLDGHDAPVEVAREREVAVELLVREHVVLREPVRCGGRVHHLRVGEGDAEVVLDHAVHHARRVGVLEGVQQLQLPARVRVGVRARVRVRGRVRLLKDQSASTCVRGERSLCLALIFTLTLTSHLDP